MKNNAGDFIQFEHGRIFFIVIYPFFPRFIVVCYPLKANSYCNTPRAKRVILGVIFILFCLNLHFFWTVQVVTYYHQVR